MPTAPGITVGLYVNTDDPGALRRTLPTVLSQDLQAPLRFVVVDDSSSQQIGATLREFGQRDSRLEVVSDLQPSSPAHARCEVLRRAGDGMVAWIDLGGLWRPRKLAEQLTALEASTSTHASTLVTCRSRRLRGAGDEPEELVPRLDGDQLHRLLSNQLIVDLHTVLGSAAAFRSVGGFETALQHRYDSEFLLRFLRAGGRLVAPPGADPLSTLAPARQRPAAPAVAAAERLIWRRHADAYRAYGRRFANRARRDELDRIARSYAKEGASARAALWRVRSVARTGVDRATRPGDLAAGRVIRRSRDSGHVDAERDHAPTAHSGAGTRPPHGDRKTLRAEEFARAGAWEEALTAWHAMDAKDRRGADADTHTEIARSYRAIGRYRDAISFTQEALKHWPDHQPLKAELAKSRAAVTDWAQCLRPGPAPSPEDFGAGAVTELGALQGSEGPIEGWVTPALPGTPTEVCLLLNGHAIIRTFAVDAAGEERGRARFSFMCRQLLEFLGDGDVLSVASHGRPLEIAGFGAAVITEPGFPGRSDDLADRIARGHVFTKFGQLRPGYTPARKRHTLELFSEVSEIVASRHGYRCIPFYGNLLGAVREHDFIAHDIGGFDAGYFSAERAPGGVRAEFLELAHELVRAGFHLEVEPFSVAVRRAPHDRIFVDLNYAWFTPSGDLQFSYGWRHTPIRDPWQARPSRQGVLGGHTVPLPNDAEAILRQLYGPTWTTPDQGFDPTARRHRAEHYLLSRDEREGLRKRHGERIHLLG
jgi:tetratricopeptide (TPR) repeat protein